jgi:glycosyltransferase involved in cell wall biosynthesis
MEALFISYKHPPSIGGIQIQNKALVDSIEQTHRVHRLIWDGHSSLPLFLATAAVRALGILRANPSITVVHLCDALMGLMALPLTALSKVPVVVTVHGLDVVLPIGLWEHLTVRRLNRYAAVIPVSEGTAQACRQRGVAPSKLRVVKNGVDMALADITPDPAYRARLEERLGTPLASKRIIVHIGRAVRRKGLSWFLNHVLPRLDEDVILLMIGPRSRNTERTAALLGRLPYSLNQQLTQLLALPLDEPEIRRAMTLPQVRGRAFELGAMPFADMMQTLQLADLFVMPNVQVEGDAEGFGLVALEASMCGLPVVVAGMEGITDAIIDGQNGFHVAPQNADAWVARLGKLLADPTNLASLGQRGRAFTRDNFSWDRMADGYREVFREVTGGRFT